MLAVLLGLSLVAGLGLGLVPALAASRRSLMSALQDGGPTVGGRRSLRARQLLMTAQVAVSVVVLVTAALLARSLGHLSEIDPGYNAEGLWVASVDARRVTLPFQDLEELGLPLRVGLLDYLEQLAEVEVVGLARESPISRMRNRSPVSPVGTETELPTPCGERLAPDISRRSSSRYLGDATSIRRLLNGSGPVTTRSVGRSPSGPRRNPAVSWVSSPTPRTEISGSPTSRFSTFRSSVVRSAMPPR